MTSQTLTTIKICKQLDKKKQNAWLYITCGVSVFNLCACVCSQQQCKPSAAALARAEGERACSPLAQHAAPAAVWKGPGHTERDDDPHCCHENYSGAWRHTDTAFLYCPPPPPPHTRNVVVDFSFTSDPGGIWKVPGGALSPMAAAAWRENTGCSEKGMSQHALTSHS